MIKLKDAKCPNCGSNLEVNDKLEKTICQYCGSTVLIEEAIQKYQIELSGKIEVEGKVEVDGIKTNKTRLEEAKKHFKVGEYSQAIKLLNELIDKEHFNIEAHCELLKNKLALNNIRENDKGLTITYGDDTKYWEAVKSINESFQRLRKIDDKNERENFLGEDVTKKLTYCQRIESKLKEDENKCKTLSDRVCSKMREYGSEYNDEAIMIFKDIFKVNFRRTTYRDNQFGEASWYKPSTIHRITRTGDILVMYSREDYNSLNESVKIERCHTFKKVNSIEDLEKRVDEYINILDENIKQKKRGKLLKKTIRDNMSLGEKIGEVFDKVATLFKVLIRLIIPVMLIIVCILKIIATIKDYGFNSDDTIAGFIGSAIICIPCIIWIIKIIINRDEY